MSLARKVRRNYARKQGTFKMKLVKLIDGEKYKSLKVLRDVAEVNPKGGTVETMRKRCKLLDKIDAAKAQDRADSMLLEDSEWEELKTALNDYPWGPNDPELLAVIDGVLDAKAPPAEAA